MSRWNYTNSTTSQHGRMQCHACRKPIIGDYRYRDGRDGFILNHRSCSTDDKMWAQRDAEQVQRRVSAEEQLKAYKAFRDRWNEEALDDVIEELEAFLKSDR